MKIPPSTFTQKPISHLINHKTILTSSLPTFSDILPIHITQTHDHYHHAFEQITFHHTQTHIHKHIMPYKQCHHFPSHNNIPDSPKDSFGGLDYYHLSQRNAIIIICETCTKDHLSCSFSQFNEAKSQIDGIDLHINLLMLMLFVLLSWCVYG